jgi:hypothetical protein
MRTSLFLPFVAVPLLSACASLAMTPPGKVDTTIDFVNLSPATIQWVTAYADDYDCAGRLYSPVFSHEPKRTRSTPRQKPYQTIQYEYLKTSLPFISICHGIYTFPTNDSTHFRVTTQDMGSNCAVKIEREETGLDSGRWIEIQPTRREHARPFWEDGGFCQPSSEYLGSSHLLKPHGFQ